MDPPDRSSEADGSNSRIGLQARREASFNSGKSLALASYSRCMADDILGTLGSIVGIGVGKLDLQLVSNAVPAGATLHGRVFLHLTRKTEASRLVCGLEATEDRVTPRGTERHEVHRFEQQLDGKRTYFDEAYDLHLPVPAQAAAPVLPSGLLGDVARLVTAVQSSRRTPVRWRVFAFLDVPWKANIRGSVDILIR
jgi:hypothetical protein